MDLSSPLLCWHKTCAMTPVWRITQKNTVIFFQTEQDLDIVSLNEKLNWGQSKSRNKLCAVQRWNVLIAQARTNAWLSILTLKYNSPACAIELYRFSWQTRCYAVCCIYREDITDHCFYWKNSNSSEAENNQQWRVTGSSTHPSKLRMWDTSALFVQSWYETLYLLTIMLLVTWPEVIIKFFLDTVM